MCLSFGYHMYADGSTGEMGILSILLEFGSGSGPEETWMRKGNLGNSWHVAYITLNINYDVYKVFRRQLSSFFRAQH